MLHRHPHEFQQMLVLEDELSQVLILFLHLHNIASAKGSARNPVRDHALFMGAFAGLAAIGNRVALDLSHLFPVLAKVDASASRRGERLPCIDHKPAQCEYNR